MQQAEKPMPMKIIAYFRVSTIKQGRSGLGLEGQQAAVEEFARRTGARTIASYTEVESGKRADRPELAKALAHARRSKATLVVAKLDRLARNLAFLAALMESGADFIAADNPNANRLTVHILAAVAEDEARRISERTKAALAAYKARGGQLGATRPQCRNLTAEARQKGAEAAGQTVRARAAEAYEDLRGVLVAMRGAGATLQAVADRLNTDGHCTRHGKLWSRVAVLRACRQLGVRAPAAEKQPRPEFLGSETREIPDQVR
jgi:DNA invertase Pin-like site-specific DNA recombinase